jgi:hypothetical protein
MRRSLDYMLGYLLFGGLFLLSFLGFVSRIQAALLFNVKFAKSLKRGRLLVRAGLYAPSAASALRLQTCCGPSGSRAMLCCASGSVLNC